MPASASLVALLAVTVAVASARADEPCAAIVSAERREADKQIKAGNAAAALPCWLPISSGFDVMGYAALR